MIKNSLLKFVGISIIITFIYLRFIIKRLPQKLTIHTSETQSIIHPIIVMGLCAITISIIIIYINLKRIFKKPFMISSNRVFKLAVFLQEFVSKALFSVKELIAQIISNSYSKMYTLIQIFYKKYGIMRKQSFSFLLLCLIP